MGAVEVETRARDSAPPRARRASSVSRGDAMNTASLARCISLCVLLAASCKSTPPEREPPAAGMVVHVEDGDTITLADGTQVRLLGINAPENGQPLNKESRSECEALLLEKTVRLEYDAEKWDRMRKRRALAYVFVEKSFVNRELLLRGMASLDIREPNIKYRDVLTQAQEAAKHDLRGVWAWKPGTPFVGNTDSKTVHKADCDLVPRMSPHNRWEFSTMEEAVRAGYHACKSCKP